ncbi:MAG: DUF4249 domain-containing protein [Bacteroidetes bacterium]|nr:DUF4249 domain-containing protein [Bacteroidota bacterium]
MIRATRNKIILPGLVLLAGLLICGCQKLYNPKPVKNSPNILVVEGVIDPSADSTIFKLSRTVQVNAKTTVAPELGAIVNAEDDQNGVYPIPEIGNGTYAFPGLRLNITRKYRLRIRTTDGKEYVSNFVPVKITPPIDSVGFTILPDSLQVYVSAHDPTGSTRYYRWSFDETWLFHAFAPSEYISNGYKLVERTIDQQIYFCYASSLSPTIVLATSNKLAHDVIYQNPLTLIKGSSEKIEREYSVLVRQYAITADALNYWANMKRNSDQLGSIFAVQPSEITGNIHCTTNAATPVIGYISASTVTSKRVFLGNNSLPRRWQPIYPYSCSIDSIPNSRVQLDLIDIPVSEFTLSYYGNVFNPLGYTATERECADCTIRGTTVQPSFWVYR